MPEDNRGGCGEQNRPSADSQTNCRQAGPARRLEKTQTAVLASRCRKAADGPALGRLSHANPPPKGGRSLPSRPRPFSINRKIRSTRVVLRVQLISGWGEMQEKMRISPIFRWSIHLRTMPCMIFFGFTIIYADSAALAGFDIRFGHFQYRVRLFFDGWPPGRIIMNRAEDDFQ